MWLIKIWVGKKVKVDICSLAALHAKRKRLPDFFGTLYFLQSLRACSKHGKVSVQRCYKLWSNYIPISYLERLRKVWGAGPFPPAFSPLQTKPLATRAGSFASPKSKQYTPLSISTSQQRSDRALQTHSHGRSREGQIQSAQAVAERKREACRGICTSPSLSTMKEQKLEAQKML